MSNAARTAKGWSAHLATITFLKTAFAPESWSSARLFTHSKTSKSQNQMERAVRDSTWKRSKPFQNLHHHGVAGTRDAREERFLPKIAAIDGLSLEIAVPIDRRTNGEEQR